MTHPTHTGAQNMLAGGLAFNPQNWVALQSHLAGCAECRLYAELHARLATELPALYPSPAESFVPLAGVLSRSRFEPERFSSGSPRERDPQGERLIGFFFLPLI
jgi:hypothetical protein